MELAEISNYKPPYFSIGVLARFLDLGPETILVLVKKGDLPAQRVDGHLRFDKKEIKQWLRGRDEGASQERMKHPSNRFVGYPQRAKRGVTLRVRGRTRGEGF